MWVTSSFSFSNGACLEVWRVSSRSLSNGQCVAVGDWRTSFRSNGTNCVAVASGARVRDSKLGDASPVLAFSPAAWGSFTERLKMQP